MGPRLALAAALLGALTAWLLWPAAPPLGAPAAPIQIPEIVELELPLPEDAAPPPPRPRPRAAPSPAPTTRPVSPLAAALGDPAAPRRAVVDFQGLIATPIGQAMLRCLPKSDRAMIGTLREAGFDVLRDVQTLAVVGEVPLVVGRFDSLDWEAIEPGRTVEQVGRTAFHADGDSAFAVWDGQVMLGHSPRAQLDEVIARLEGQAPLGVAPSPRGLAYGEIPADDLVDLLPLEMGAARPLAELLNREGAGLDFHVTAAGETLQIDARLAHAGPIAAQALAAVFDTVKAGGLRAGASQGFADLLAPLSVRARGADIAAGLPLSLEAVEAALGDCAREGSLP